MTGGSTVHPQLSGAGCSSVGGPRGAGRPPPGRPPRRSRVALPGSRVAWPVEVDRWCARQAVVDHFYRRGRVVMRK